MCVCVTLEQVGTPLLGPQVSGAGQYGRTDKGIVGHCAEEKALQCVSAE